MSLGKETLVVGLSRSLFQIETRAESALPGAAENTDANFRVPSHPLADIDDLTPHLLIHRIQNLRAIQRNITNVVSNVIDDCLVTHDRPSSLRKIPDALNFRSPFQKTISGFVLMHTSSHGVLPSTAMHESALTV
jgi:hypothetical protein